jgi:putative transposase
MPRTARIVIPGYPHHVIQRGHNRQVVFAGDDDFRYYLDNLRQWKELYRCRVYAFCLMTNHVHLVIDPGDQPENLGRLMKRVAGRQTRFVNRLEGRSGTLWESRYKSSPIDTDSYLLACCRYVEMNPVRAGMLEDPADYPWSSCAARVGARPLDWLDPDPCYLALGDNEVERQRRYREYLRETASEREQEVILAAIRRGQLTGGAAFVDEIEARLNRRVELRGRGRPRKAGK